MAMFWGGGDFFLEKKLEKNPSDFYSLISEH
jgi:hypothetical protein